ncbi:MAG: hypothetical protein M3340_07485 [Actinomycetota bacterium]|nr:hypothetical protein [Actinomycetota bacterium]
MRFARWNGLSIVFGLLFLGALVFQAIAGHADFNEEQRQHHASDVSFGRYVTSAAYAVAVLENWQSEYLQFALYVLATVWLIQLGSTESKQLGKEGGESDEEQKVGEHADDESPPSARAGGLRTLLYSNSLFIVMGLIFLGSWAAQSVTGWVEYSDQRFEHQMDTISWWSYLGSADFWERSLQNWQSEFLAVGSMAILSVYLRQRGSSQSKPVGSAHHATAEEG